MGYFLDTLFLYYISTLIFFFEQQRNTSNYWSESHTIFIKAIVYVVIMMK